MAASVVLEVENIFIVYRVTRVCVLVIQSEGADGR